MSRYKQPLVFGTEVPLYPKRQRSRGFNQAKLFAQFCCNSGLIPYGSDIVRRIKDTPSQARITLYKTRYENMRGAFALSKGLGTVAGHTYIVFDDVWTSGATIKELTRILKRGKAAKVYGVTLAR